MLMVFSAGGFLIAGWRWIGNLRLARHLEVSQVVRGALWGVPLLCAGGMFAGLFRWADPEVRGNWLYLALLILLGCTGLGIATLCFEWLGLGLRSDALEANNSAAAIAWSGAMFGFLAAYAGGNAGAGSSLWQNVFSVCLAEGALLGSWLLLELGWRTSSSVTLERDLASGIRNAGFLAAAGLVCGRAVAGDWHSALETLHDFARAGWTLVVLIAFAGAAESTLRPNARQIAPSIWTHGVCPATVCLVLAAAWLVFLGPWEGHQ